MGLGSGGCGEVGGGQERGEEGRKGGAGLLLCLFFNPFLGYHHNQKGFTPFLLTVSDSLYHSQTNA